MAKKPKQTDQEQYQRFLEKVQELVDTGELSPTKADEKFERVIDKIASSDYEK